MVITNLEEKENRKIWVPIRGGNRGGWSLFNWENVRQMPYKDRQMYLANSVTIGVLDKGGKWRKRDWYMKTDKKCHNHHLEAQQTQAIKKDYERMANALGITDKQDQQHLTQQQMEELMNKIKTKKQTHEASLDAIGLGFDKTKVQIRAKPSLKTDNPYRLEGTNDFKLEQKYERKEQKNKELDQREKSEQKKIKKKKHKKSKKSKHQRRERSRSKQRQPRRRHSSSSQPSFKKTDKGWNFTE